MKVRNRIAVLGCGPAGLLAAQAATSCGYDVDIYSRRIQSVIRGAQFLHDPIEGITGPEPDRSIYIRHLGTEKGYAEKVYGSPEATCSWSEYPEGEFVVWSLESAYMKLWTKFYDQITDCDVNYGVAKILAEKYQLLISSVPLPILAPEATYYYQNIWVRSMADSHPSHRKELDYITWNGEPGTSWYRKSKLFGRVEIEYPIDKGPEGATLVKKPIKSEGADDVLPQMLRVGRYGEFRKGVLVHDAYHNTIERLES